MRGHRRRDAGRRCGAEHGGGCQDGAALPMGADSAGQPGLQHTGIRGVGGDVLQRLAEVGVAGHGRFSFAVSVTRSVASARDAVLRTVDTEQLSTSAISGSRRSSKNRNAITVR
jgi:hypothetical protein